MTQNRIHYIDIAKGILILMVIFHHLTHNAHYTFGIETDTFQMIDNINLFYMCFFMQAFFLISGYCSSFTESFKTLIKKNLKQLILPALCISIMVRFVRFVVYQDISYLQIIFKPHYWAYAFGGYWFVYTLFICRVVYWLIHKYIKNNYLHWVLVLFGLIICIISDFPITLGNRDFVLPNVFFWKNAGANLIFLAIGFKYKTILFRKNYLKISSILFLFLFTVLTIYGRKITVYTMSANVLLNDIPIFMTLAFLGSMFSIYVSYLLKENSVLEKFGKQSLLVYLSHGLYLNIFIDFTNRYLLHPKDCLSSIIFYVFVSLVTIVFCWLTIKLLEKKQLSWILGKW